MQQRKTQSTLRAKPTRSSQLHQLNSARHTEIPKPTEDFKMKRYQQVQAVVNTNRATTAAAQK